MAHQLKLQGIKINQPGLAPGKAVFSSVIKVSDLLDDSAFKVDYWDKEKEGGEQGYQRSVNELHVKKISEYLCSTDSLLPNSLILSTRDYMPGFHEGTIILDHFPLYIVDGQHRVEALRDAVNSKEATHWKDAVMPVLILSGFGRFEEMVQFVDLNTKQKKVATDLAMQLMLEMSKDGVWHQKFKEVGSEWKVRAIKTVNELNKRMDSPWHGAIKMPGETAKTGHFRTTANSFTVSLRPLMTNSFGRNLDNNILILSNYWRALREIFPDAFMQPKEYAIQKTPGLFSLHSLLQTILSNRGYDFGLDQKNLTPILKAVFERAGREVDFWRSDNRIGVTQYGSMKGFRLLSEEFAGAFEELNEMKNQKK
jgi:DGQHR domain-containing protein